MLRFAIFSSIFSGEVRSICCHILILIFTLYSLLAVMGSKKRCSSSMEEVEKLVDTQIESPISNSIKKKIKKDKKKDPETADVFPTAGPSAIPSSIKPMERKKKRKALDKERHRTAAALENEESKPKQMDVDLKVNEHRAQMVGSLSSSGLPEFHIGVFKDLVSVDVSVREGAVERLVTELLEVQKAYEAVENENLVEGMLKLEAEKNDGLNDCAPSLRYAVRRLIRGVSSSREV